MDQTHYEQIEELAELQFSKEEVAVIVETTAAKIVEDKQAALAYRRGTLKAQAEVRRAMLQMAKQGSTPAQKQFLELVKPENSNTEWAIE